jgi:hypothetical protein
MLLEPFHHHPTKINNIQDNHDIPKQRRKPSRGQELIDSPQKKRRTHDQGFEQVEQLWSREYLKPKIGNTNQE